VSAKNGPFWKGAGCEADLHEQARHCPQCGLFCRSRRLRQWPLSLRLAILKNKVGKRKHSARHDSKFMGYAMTMIFENWSYISDVVTFSISILAILVSAGFFIRRKRTITELIYVEQDRDNLKRKLNAAGIRLQQVDPERFIDSVIEIKRLGNLVDLEAKAQEYLLWQQEGIGEACEILANAYLETSVDGNKHTVEKAERYVEAGLALVPEHTGLVKMRQRLKMRLNDIEMGDPIEALEWNGLSAQELHDLFHELRAEGKYELSSVVARRGAVQSLTEDGGKSARYAGALANYGQSLLMAGGVESLAPYPLAEFYLLQALSLSKNISAISDNSMATILNNLGLAIQAQGRHDEANDFYSKAKNYANKTTDKRLIEMTDRHWSGNKTHLSDVCGDEST
jgi:tetratricopeptide (TPR) repeat protein